MQLPQSPLFFNQENNKSIFLWLVSLFLLIQSSNLLAATVGNRWHPGIGDPSIHGWITVVFYFIATVISANKFITLKKMGEGYRFWLFITVFLLLLGINKQLDLQTWFTQTLRDSAHVHGWYESRRQFQALFILGLAITTLFSLVSIRRFLAKSWHRHKIAWVGIELLCAFVLVRAASFHHFDVFINHHWLGVRFNVLLEIGAIIIIIVGAIKEGKPSKKRSQLA
ncbi:MAG: hypothetical protein WBP13_11080 [Methylophilaceae bacterium]